MPSPANCAKPTVAVSSCIPPAFAEVAAAASMMAWRSPSGVPLVEAREAQSALAAATVASEPGHATPLCWIASVMAFECCAAKYGSPGRNVWPGTRTVPRRK